MPRRVYSPDEKANTLQALAKNAGDIAATSHQTGIPQRTLYTWRMEEWDQQRQRRQSQPLPPPNESTQFEDATEVLEHIRNQMFRVLNRIPADLSQLPPYLQRDRHAARITLVDIIIKLTHLIPKTEYDEIEDDTEESETEPQITKPYIHVPLPVYVSDDATDGLPPMLPA